MSLSSRVSITMSTSVRASASVPLLLPWGSLLLPPGSGSRPDPAASRPPV